MASTDTTHKIVRFRFLLHLGCVHRGVTLPPKVSVLMVTSDEKAGMMSYEDIQRHNEEYVQRIGVLERELEQRKAKMATMRPDDPMLQNESTTVAAPDALSLIANNTTRVHKGHILAVKVPINCSDDENSIENESNKENNQDQTKLCDESASIISSLSQQLYETANERDNLKSLVTELRSELDDYKEVYGTLSDLSEIRHQYENLLKDEYEFVNNIAYADIMSGNASQSISSEQTKREIDRICNDINMFMLDMKSQNGAQA